MHETKRPNIDQVTPRELSLTDALTLAINLHRADELEDAELLYHRIIEASPDNADARHFLGILLHQRGRSEEGLRHIERSIVLSPEDANRYNNLGNVLVELGQIVEATAAYNKALKLTPDHPDAWNNLGAVLRVQGRFEEAEAAYLKAIELAPENVHAYNNYGNLLAGQKRIREAIAYYSKAIAIVPDQVNSMRLLAAAYYALGQVDAAAEVYRKWLKENPDDAIAKHMLASCSGEDVPARASDAFIITTYDSFAGSFDQKLESLSYRAPQLVADAVGKMNDATPTLTVLDAGCGTGLCGPLIAPYAARLVGVDLSSHMLAAAKRRNIYDELVNCELGAYLDTHVDTFDLVISADTLVYFGELKGVFASTGKALHSGGMFIFTVEESKEGSAAKGYKLNPHGRYSHRLDYLIATLEGAGFPTPTIEHAVLRMELGNHVAGLVVAARKK